MRIEAVVYVGEFPRSRYRVVAKNNKWIAECKTYKSAARIIKALEKSHES
jgi:hypothetical protein